MGKFGVVFRVLWGLGPVRRTRVPWGGRVGPVPMGVISVAQIRPPGGSYAHKGLHTAPWGPEAPTHRARTAEGRYTQGRRPPHTAVIWRRS